MARSIAVSFSFLGLILGLVQVPATATAAETYPGFSSRGIPLNGQTLLGACSSCTSRSQDPTTAEAKFGGRKFGIHRTYYRADQQSSAVNRAKSDAAAGRVPWMSFKLPNGYDFKDMADGKGDVWARDLASRLGAVDGPVWVAVHHEPENDGQNLQDWKAMQRRLSPIFRAHSNVAFTVILMGYHQFMAPNINPALSMDAIWPGTRYVDVTGFDVYNLYGTLNSSGTRITAWRELRDYYEKFSSWSAANGGAKWAVGETGYTDAAVAKDVRWLGRAYDDMKRFGGVALTYWDCTKPGSPSNAYDLTGSAERAEFASALDRSDRLSSGGAATTPASPDSGSISFRGAAGVTDNSTSATLTVPNDVTPGDALLLFASANRSDVVISDPSARWSRVRTVVDGSMQTTGWVTVARAGDAGSDLSVTSSERAKLNVQILAYGGTDGQDPIASVTATPESGSSIRHKTPTDSAVPAGARIVSHWSEKVTGPAGWTAPTGQIQRQQTQTGGGGAVNAMTSDIQGAQGTGGGYVATSSTPANKATMWTVVLRPS